MLAKFQFIGSPLTMSCDIYRAPKTDQNFKGIPNICFSATFPNPKLFSLLLFFSFSFSHLLSSSFSRGCPLVPLTHWTRVLQHFLAGPLQALPFSEHVWVRKVGFCKVDLSFIFEESGVRLLIILFKKIFRIG